MLATPRWQWLKSYNEKSWSRTTRTMKYGPYICDQCLWIDTFLHSLGDTKISESHKLKRFSTRNQFKAAPFVTVWIIACSINAMETVVCNYCVDGLETTNSRYVTLDRCPLTSSEMSVLHASHSMLKNPLWKILVRDHSDHEIWTLYMWSLPFDRSSRSCILCERQKISESHKLKHFGAWNQFRAGQFVTILIIACSINAIERVVCNYCVGGLGTTNSRYMSLDRWPLTSSEMSALHTSHSMLKIESYCEKILVRDHSDHEIWTLCMWSVPLDRCSPAYSGRDKKFRKVTNWSALVPEISSEQHNLCPLWLLHVASMQWREWSGCSRDQK